MSLIRRADVAIIGGGIAGAAAAGEIAPTRSVVLLEQEAELAHHTTSRSAATLHGATRHLPVAGAAQTASPTQTLVRSARPFFEADHPELDAPLLEPLPVLTVGSAGMEDELRRQAEHDAKLTPSMRFLDDASLFDVCPVLDRDVVTCGIHDPSAATIDVMAAHQLFIRRARGAGADVLRSSRVGAIASGGDSGARWRLETASGPIDCDIIVNAAGAWGDGVAEMAGVRPVGLTPMRRTAFTTRVDVDPNDWPFVYSRIPELPGYFKPEAGQQLLCSLSDETPSEPLDARPEELDIALAIENINTISTLGLRSVATTWAGLRTFAPDREPVFGWDDAVDGFFWLVGQGGWGIVNSPPAARVAAAAINDEPFPADLRDLGLSAADLAPRRSLG